MSGQFPGFEQCINMIRSDDALTFEDGFAWLLAPNEEISPEYVDKLIELMMIETEPKTRARFVELLGYTHQKKVVHLLAAELRHPAREVREWAILSLEELAFPEAIELSKKYKEQHQEEWGE